MMACCNVSPGFFWAIVVRVRSKASAKTEILLIEIYLIEIKDINKHSIDIPPLRPEEMGVLNWKSIS